MKRNVSFFKFLKKEGFWLSVIITFGVVMIGLVGFWFIENYQRNELTEKRKEEIQPYLNNFKSQEYEVIKFSKLELYKGYISDLSFEETSKEFGYIAKDNELKNLYDTEIQYLDPDGVLHTSSEAVFVKYDGNISKPKLVITIVPENHLTKEMNKYVNPTLYIPKQ
ncbi:hypothetical protein U0X36_25765 [Bacillus thuringiensis]|uniref:hypothetical protein n=1 Tax=Bacillus thuringiensis TaxID=1428 RepID=UPI000E482CE7|nr:hypothetical protein [Bacillus thuringiensis]MDZ3956221.1 hypothetical protein [Bacillus thuringiensis]RGP42935.1 hypothetical protein BTW32_30655 [Bacillus thuringiensis]